MTFKKIGMVVLAAVLAAGVFGCKKKDEAKEGAPAASGNTIKIGFLGALTGDVAMFGGPSLQGMKMAAEEINAAGGVLGKKIEIAEADNRGDKQEGASITQKFISRDKVVAIIGDPTTGITKVAAPIAQKAGVVLLSGGSTGPGVVENGDFIYRDTLLDSVAIPACIGYFANTLKFRNVAVITSDNNDYSVGLSQTFRDAAKSVPEIKIVADEKVKDGDKDFSAQITNIKGKNPDVIFFSGYYTEGALIMKEARKQGMKAVMFGGDGLFSPKFIELGGPAVEGSMVALGFSPEQGSPETTKFVADFKKKYNEVPGVFAAQAYDSMLLLADAMKRANSTDPKVFKNELAKTKNFKGASGTITIRANREPIKSPLSLLMVKDGKFVLKSTVAVKME
ncbi:ABC transporter substrate-binding protein [Geomesophilobacter sediminis]|uniref:ABC transporter substrate-binding protein n=1 Tax=Geomesophilobacter sediminis TaxID=2798584 RepID=A0A8J7JBP3_9BACT|nr:ABC transporter substrate-binding protein [Geomesophilobacter sediminis]MBJ6724013.1 ABC transporter substrate-binding protein [Geomesophilobacter sediminis]